LKNTDRISIISKNINRNKQFINLNNLNIQSNQQNAYKNLIDFSTLKRSLNDLRFSIKKEHIPSDFNESNLHMKSTTAYKSEMQSIGFDYNKFNIMELVLNDINLTLLSNKHKKRKKSQISECSYDKLKYLQLQSK